MKAVLQRGVWVLVAAIALMATGCSATPGENKTEARTETSGGATAIQTWNPGTGALTITVASSPRLRQGWCWAGIFDWKIDRPGNDHHDSRLVMVCQPGISKSFTFNDSPKSGLRGMNKAGLCYGPRSKVNVSEQNCKPAAGSPSVATVQATGLSAQTPNKCISAYIVEANGAITSNDGGDHEACDN